MERNSRKCLWLVGLCVILIFFLYIFLCYSIQGLTMHSFLIRNKQCCSFFKVIFYSISVPLIQVAWLQFSVAVIKNCHTFKGLNYIHLTFHRPICSTSLSVLGSQNWKQGISWASTGTDRGKSDRNVIQVLSQTQSPVVVEMKAFLPAYQLNAALRFYKFLSDTWA